MSAVRDGITKRGNTWSYVIRVHDPETGRSKVKWVGGFPSEAEAKAARDEARVAARRGQYIDRTRVLVGEYLREWLNVHAHAVKPKTLDSYEYHVERYIIPRLGHVQLQSLRPAAVSKFYRELAVSGGVGGRALSPRSVDAVHRTLRKALNDAVRIEQLLASNPAERATRPKEMRSRRGDMWGPAELRRFLEVAQIHRLGAFFHLAAYTGARRGELLGLRWGDLDLEALLMSIRRSEAVVAGRRVEGTPKSGRSRTVRIDVGTASVLREHRKRQTAERLAAGPLWADIDGRVFTTELGAPLYPDTPSQLMRKLVAKAGLPSGRLHDLRHAHATTLLLAGQPVHVAADRLGHANPSITLQVYAHVLAEQAAGVADVFADALRCAR